jgi:hypothetical protein
MAPCLIFYALPAERGSQVAWAGVGAARGSGEDEKQTLGIFVQKRMNS